MSGAQEGRAERRATISSAFRESMKDAGFLYAEDILRHAENDEMLWQLIWRYVQPEAAGRDERQFILFIMGLRMGELSRPK